MKVYLSRNLIILAILMTCGTYAQETVSNLSANKLSPEELQVLIGDWTGSLTYIDYSSGNPFTMPANVSIKKGKNENELILFNEYPNEPKANNEDRIILSKDGKLLNKKSLKSKERLENGQIQITTEYNGKDNRKKALIRNIYILGETVFIIRKEVQFENSQEWLKRNEFSYTR